MKDKIIDYHPIKGYITFRDLINDLELILEDYKILEGIVIILLENSNFDNETIASLFANDIASRLNNLVYILKDRL